MKSREKSMLGHRMMGCVVATTFLDTARLVAKITDYIHPRYHHSKYRKILFISSYCTLLIPLVALSVLSVHREAMSVLSPCASLGFRMFRVIRCSTNGEKSPAMTWCFMSSQVAFSAFTYNHLCLHLRRNAPPRALLRLESQSASTRITVCFDSNHILLRLEPRSASTRTTRPQRPRGVCRAPFRTHRDGAETQREQVCRLMPTPEMHDGGPGTHNGRAPGFRLKYSNSMQHFTLTAV